MFTAGRIRVIALGIADLVCISMMWTAVVVGFQYVNMMVNPHFVYGEKGAWIFLDLWPTAVAFVLLNALFELYHGNWAYPASPLSQVEEFRRLVSSAILTHLGLIAVLVFARQSTEGYSRWVIALSGMLTALGVQSFRNWGRRLLFMAGWGQIPVVLAGGGDVAKKIAAILRDNAYVGMRIVGYFEGASRIGRKARRRTWNARFFEDDNIKYLGSLRDIVTESRKRDIKILLACQDERLFRCQLEEFTSWFTYIEYLPTARTFPIFGAKAIVFDGIGGLEMVNQGRMRAKRFRKMVIDNLLAAIAFTVALPIFIIVPLLIKLTSRGPIFYRQERLGRHGEHIRVWKFRSMYADADERLARLIASNPKFAAEWKSNFKLSRDPRVTPLGRFLRKTSLDELPQLFNVFSGEMALIGPRPIVDGEVPYYGDAYQVFSSVRPGITGLWQVSGRSDTDYTRRVSLDVYYVLNWSFWMDIWILVRTVYAVVFMRGAR